jgi:hypothetical protein
MDPTTRRRLLLLVAVVLAIALCSAPALAHDGHAEHEDQGESGLSVWPFLAVFGTVVASGSVLAGVRFDVRRQLAIGMGAGGLAMAAVAGTIWLL